MWTVECIQFTHCKSMSMMSSKRRITCKNRFTTLHFFFFFFLPDWGTACLPNATWNSPATLLMCKTWQRLFNFQFSKNRPTYAFNITSISSTIMSSFQRCFYLAGLFCLKKCLQPKLSRQSLTISLLNSNCCSPAESIASNPNSGQDKPEKNQKVFLVLLLVAIELFTRKFEIKLNG